MATWHVNIFRIRKSRRTLFGHKRKVLVGYGWSASSPDGGYLFHDVVAKDDKAALVDATATVEATGGTVGSTSLDESGIEQEDARA